MQFILNRLLGLFREAFLDRNENGFWRKINSQHDVSSSCRWNRLNWLLLAGSLLSPLPLFVNLCICLPEVPTPVAEWEFCHEKRFETGIQNSSSSWDASHGSRSDPA